MARLDEILKSISDDLINLQKVNDKQSLEVLQAYQENGILKHLDAPRFTISGVKLNLKFTVSEVNETVNFDFSEFRKKWLALLKLTPIEFLNEFLGKIEQFPIMVNQIFSKIKPPDFHVRAHLLGKEDLKAISSNYLIKVLSTMPEEEKNLLPRNIENEIMRSVESTLKDFDGFSDLQNELTALSFEVGTAWQNKIIDIPTTIITKDLITGLTTNEINSIRNPIAIACDKITKPNFSIDRALSGNTSISLQKTKSYFIAAYNYLPTAVKQKITIQSFQTDNHLNKAEKILTDNLSLLTSIANTRINESLRKLWPAIIEQEIATIIPKLQLKAPAPKVDLPGKQMSKLPGKVPEKPEILIFNTNEVKIISQTLPSLSLQQVLRTTVSDDSIKSIIDNIDAILKPKSNQFTSIPTKVQLRDQLKLKAKLEALIPEIKKDMIETVESKLAELLRTYAINTVLEIFVAHEETAVFNEFKAKSEIVEINNLNSLIRKALLNEKNDLFIHTVSALSAIPELMNPALGKRVPAGLMNRDRLFKELNKTYDEIFPNNLKNFANSVNVFESGWDDKLKEITGKLCQDSLSSYEKLIPGLKEAVERYAPDVENLIISDNDIKLATQAESPDSNSLIKNSCLYLDRLLNKKISQDISRRMPIAFSNSMYFVKILEKKFNDSKGELKSSILKTTSFNELDINIKDSDIKGSSAINEIYIDLTPNFIKVIDE